MIRAAFAAALLLAAPSALAQAPAPTPVELTAPGPEGALGATLLDPGARTPLVLIVPGSGPTDRDGNNRLAVKGAPYRQLAEALAAQGVATLRIDKRGMFGSRAALASPNAVTIGAYADDVHAWAKVVREKTGRRCIWVLGHSEGGLVALQAAQGASDICGLVLLSAPGRRLGAVMREQFKANPANAPFLDAALSALDAFEAGHVVSAATLPAPLPMVFPDSVQPFMIDLLALDPAKLAAAVRVPVLVLQGDRDIQVSLDDAKALEAAQPKATLVVLPGVNHVLRPVASDDRMANIATYGDETLPISPSVAAAVAGFVKR